MNVEFVIFEKQATKDGLDGEGLPIGQVNR
jgi:hypothetical protein